MSNKLVLFNTKLTTNAKAIYLYLDRHGARKNQCFHSARTIANSLDMSTRTVYRSLNVLEKNGFILRTHRYRKDGAKTSNLYEILK